MTVDRGSELEQLRLRVRDRVTRSGTLAAGARIRALAQRDRAQASFLRAEDGFSHAARRLPAMYGLTAPDPVGTGPGAVLAVVVAATRSLYPNARDVSVTAVAQTAAVDRRCYCTVLASNPENPLDAAQYSLGEGPTVDAVDVDHVTPVRADDLTGSDAHGSWPLFAAVAVGAGIRSMISVPVPWTRFLHPGRTRTVVSAITAYAAHAHAFGEPEAHALLLGTWAGSVLTGRSPAEIYDAAVWRPHGLPPEWSQDAPPST